MRYLTPPEAVFDDEVVRHYQGFLHRRRAQHFDRRKVELGNRARPYGTRCQHEHACLRCLVLHIDPGMLRRLNEIETDLHARRIRAETKDGSARSRAST